MVHPERDANNVAQRVRVKCFLIKSAIKQSKLDMFQVTIVVGFINIKVAKQID